VNIFSSSVISDCLFHDSLLKVNITAHVFEVPAGPISPIDILFGHRQSLAQGNLFMAHRTGFTEKTLFTTLKNSGFKTVAIMKRLHYFDLWALGTKSALSEAQMQVLTNAHFPKT
jgi:hypothetical protein